MIGQICDSSYFVVFCLKNVAVVQVLRDGWETHMPLYTWWWFCSVKTNYQLPSNTIFVQPFRSVYVWNGICLFSCHHICSHTSRDCPIYRRYITIHVCWKQWLLPTAVQFVLLMVQESAYVSGSVLLIWHQDTNYAVTVESNHCFQAWDIQKLDTFFGGEGLLFSIAQTSLRIANLLLLLLSKGWALF